MTRGGRTAFAALVVGALLAGVADRSLAAREEKDAQQYTVSEKVGKKLAEVYDAIQAEDFDAALVLLDAFDLERLDAYPAALVHQAYGFIEVTRDDYEKASARFQMALDLEALPPTQQLSMRFNLGQMYMLLDHWDDAVATLQLWFAESDQLSPVAFYMLALAYYQAGDQAAALAPAREAVERSDDPRETWIQLLLSLHMAEQNFEEALPLLERLVLRYPKPHYWTQLSGVLAELEREKDSLATQQLAHALGMLDEERELVRLSQTCVVQGVPWQGARVLRDALGEGRVGSESDNWRLYANTLLAARENEMALEPLQRAAELAEDGETYLQLGQVYLQSERWEDARDVLAKALAKGGLESPARVHLLIGVAAYQQKRLDTARRALAQALRDEEVRDTAQQWLDFVEREQQRAMEVEPG